MESRTGIPILLLEASAEEFTLERRPGGLWLRRVYYVTAEQSEVRVDDLEGVFVALKDTALPFCEVTWLVPPEQRPAGHEELASRVQFLVEEFQSDAATLLFEQ